MTAEQILHNIEKEKISTNWCCKLFFEKKILGEEQEEDISQMPFSSGCGKLPARSGVSECL